MEKSIYTENILQISSEVNASLAILVCIVILFQRIAITLFGYQFSIGMIIFFVFMLFWLIKKDIQIIRERLFFFLIVFLFIIISALISSYYSKSFSVPSLVLLIGLYFWSVFAFKENVQIVALKYFHAIMLICSIIGVLQFLTQSMGISYRDWLSFIPPQFIITNYNYSAPITNGSFLYKSNGIIFLEPSFFSQMVALAIIIEIYYYKKYWRLLILLPALLFSFSGTGLILLAIGLLPLIFSQKWKNIILIGCILLSFLYLFYSSGFSSYTFNRINEFRMPNTSGYMRFISPIKTYIDFTSKEGDTAKFWFGLGPGVSEDYRWNIGTYWNTVMKLIIEYGIAGLMFFSYLVFIFFSKRTFWLSLSVFLMFSVLSGSLLIAQYVVFYYPLILLHRRSLLRK